MDQQRINIVELKDLFLPYVDGVFRASRVARRVSKSSYKARERADALYSTCFQARVIFTLSSNATLVGLLLHAWLRTFAFRSGFPVSFSRFHAISLSYRQLPDFVRILSHDNPAINNRIRDARANL